jgi:hypothetical protein
MEKYDMLVLANAWERALEHFVLIHQVESPECHLMMRSFLDIMFDNRKISAQEYFALEDALYNLITGPTGDF